MPEVIRLEDTKDLIPTSKYKYGSWDFDTFNPVQSTLMDTYDSDCNICIATATSSGKTVAAEMYMAYAIRKRKKKSIYVGPLKALASEKEQDWTDKGHHFNDLNISIVTGDYRFTGRRIKELDETDIVVMTPEMLASRCRNNKSDKSRFLYDVDCVVFDESHLLTVPSRGDHIEVALMKLVDINPDIKIVMLSATMPNVDEVCGWVCKLTGRDTHFLESSYRPCPLNIHYETYYDGDRYYDQKEEEKISTAINIVEYYRDDKFLVFCHTKRTGHLMVKMLANYGVKAEFHNADLGKDKRQKLEKKFKEDKNFRVVVATSTLAWGCYEHGSRLMTPKGCLIDVADVQKDTEILCPVKYDTYKSRRVVRAESFRASSGYFVKLESGEEMKVSEDHVFMAATKRLSPDWVEVKNLSKGDFLARPSNTHIWVNPVKFNRFWYLLGFMFGDGCLCDVGKHADGSQKALLDICLGKQDCHADYIKECFDDQFGTSVNFKQDVNDVTHICTKKKSVIDQLLPLLPLGRKQGNDDLPLEIYDDQDRICSFLSGLFDADGGVETHGSGNYSVGLTNISKSLIESVRTILIGFGIVSSLGKKKMKDTVINGRLQKAVRKHSYRLRIFGRDNLEKFSKFIGFKHEEKRVKLHEVLVSNFNYEKDLVPARELLQEHLELNSMRPSHFREITGCDLWNSVHRQDCRRDTLIKLFHKSHNVDTPLVKLLENPVRWSRISEVAPCDGGMFREIEVEDPHAYVGCGVISHNCNLPARRVIVVGIHRGLTEVENYDIQQMVGRAGRPRFDPVGDAYVLVPESEKNEQIAKLRKKQPIKSTLLDWVGKPDSDVENRHYKTLAFHVVSEIHRGSIKTKEQFHIWYRKSLAHYQDHEFDDGVVDRVLAMLIQYRAIKLEDDEYKCTALGTIASMYYYSPFDVSDLKRNFHKLFESGKQGDDFAVAMAMGNVDSFRWNIANKGEKLEMDRFRAKIERMYGEHAFTIGAIKMGFAHLLMLQGKHNIPTFAAIQGGLRVDLERTMQVINSIDGMASGWNKKEWFKVLKMRLQYGVPENMVELCQIPNVGHVRANRLKKKGIHKLSDFLSYDEGDLMNFMKCSKKLAEEALEGARLIELKESIDV